MTLPDTATRAKAREIAEKIVSTYIRGRKPLETHAEMVDDIEAALLSSGEAAGEPVALLEEARNAMRGLPMYERDLVGRLVAVIAKQDGSPLGFTTAHEIVHLDQGFSPARFVKNSDREWAIPLYRHPAPREALPADVRTLVIAARIVSLEDQSPDARKRLDVAAEAFADRVPWDDEPESELASPVLGSE